MDIEDHIGPGEDQVLVASLVLGSSEIVGTEIAVLEHGPHGAVEHQNPLAHEREQLFSAVGSG